ncbi:MAG: hypothetical protein OQL19_14980 [Gammaproteobacteria bacterium]|nr:hypothetical protein [Gammaproteobacteria bacterium]
MIDLTSHILGKTDEHIEVDLRDDLKQLILSMTQQAKHRILIFTHDLDHNLFDTDELYDAIKTLAIENQRTHVHILVQDAKPMTKKGHRLLNLARRITSHMQIKITAREHKDIIETFIVFDDRAYIIQNHPERYEAEGNFYAPLKTRQLSEQFEELWNRGVIDSSLRRLSL